jgi:hypothetical protein
MNSPTRHFSKTTYQWTYAKSAFAAKFQLNKTEWFIARWNQDKVGTRLHERGDWYKLRSCADSSRVKLHESLEL